MRYLTAAQDQLTKAKLFHSDLTPNNIMLHVPSETHKLNRLDFYKNKLMLKEAKVKIIDFANIDQLRKKSDGLGGYIEVVESKLVIGKPEYFSCSLVSQT